MTPAARLSAAIELIETIDAQRVPAAKALKEWGTAHRYAGSGDRAAISGLIWDVLRRRASSAWIMDDDTPRARMLGMLKLERGMDVDDIAALCDGGRFAPAAVERRRARRADVAVAGGRARAHRRRLSRMARRLSGAGVRRRPGRGGDRDGEPRAARFARQHPESQAREGAGIDRASGHQADAVVAARPAHRARRRRPQSRHSCRGGFHQGRDRGAGRGLAAGGAVVGGQTRRAGDRPLRRRRRQDPGAGGDDAEARAG